MLLVLILTMFCVTLLLYSKGDNIDSLLLLLAVKQVVALGSDLQMRALSKRFFQPERRLQHQTN
jgi:uncharacterized membrane protein YjjP (DUF1212 family)